MITTSIKREISHQEKSQLQLKTRALVFVGDEQAAEVKELLDIGFLQSNIVCVDTTIRNLYYVKEHYPSCPVVPGEFKSYLAKEYKNYSWSYVHLDYCGYPRTAEHNRLTELVQAAKNIAVGGRIRATWTIGQPRNEHYGLGMYPDQIKDYINNRLCANFDFGGMKGYTSDRHLRLPMITMWFDRIR